MHKKHINIVCILLVAATLISSALAHPLHLRTLFGIKESVQLVIDYCKQMMDIEQEEQEKQQLSNEELSWYYMYRGKGLVPRIDHKDMLEANDGYYVGDTSRKAIYLTFDCGYENGYTPLVLDTLKEHGVKAAFFLTDHYINSKPELVERMAIEGHILANHSDNHPNMVEMLEENPDRFSEELSVVEQRLQSKIGIDMDPYFRFPMGIYSERALDRVSHLGYKSVFWSFAYMDWDVNNQPTKEEALEKITNGAHPGAIMLLHVISETNANVLGEVIQNLKAEGYEFDVLHELK